MKFFIVDDDASIRAILTNIIDHEQLGTIEGESNDGANITGSLLTLKHIDILIIDLLMPKRDGIETIRAIKPLFHGKIVMISQVETKDLIGEAYSLGIEYYITKPINRVEVITILNKVKERVILEKSIQDIKHSLSFLTESTSISKVENTLHSQSNLVQSANHLFSELGILCESGHRDLLDILEILNQHELEGQHELPSLKEIFEEVARKKLGTNGSLLKEAKSAEQRVRRAIHQALEHIAALGVNDYSNSTFEYYASRYFDFSQVRMKMLEIKGTPSEQASPARINIKKFIQVLYMDVAQES